MRLLKPLEVGTITINSTLDIDAIVMNNHNQYKKYMPQKKMQEKIDGKSCMGIITDRE